MTSDVGLAAYGALTSTIVSNEEQFLRKFQSTMREAAKAVSAEMLQQVLVDAMRFSENLCAQLAEVLRSHSKRPEVLLSGNETLARVIRSRCFERVDGQLAEYIEVLTKLDIDVRAVHDQAGLSNVSQLISGQLESTAAARYRLPAAGRGVAMLRILDYLSSLERLPDQLFDYCAGKLSQSDTDMSRESLISNIHDAIDPLHHTCINLIANLDVVRRRKWEDRSAAESAAIDSLACFASIKHTKKKTGSGYLLTGLVCSVPAFYLTYSGEMNLYLGAFAAITTILALFFFYRTVATLSHML